MGPKRAPEGKSVAVMLAPKTASQVAYYISAMGAIGVLAPRDWNCFGTYGSNGDALYVSPQPIDRAKLFSTDQSGFTGPVIELAQSIGDTSGRFTVADIIARVFPAFRDFATHVMSESNPPFQKYTFRPYPEDVLTYKSKTVVEYQTPANAEGLGTQSRLKKNASPIEGVAILIGDTPDALLLSVRLPPGLAGLAPAIVQRVEHDAAGLPSQ